MAEPEDQNPDEARLVFAAHDNHSKYCGLPPRVHNTDKPALYYGYFENCFGEQFVFVFDPAAKTGTIHGGDFEWGNPKTFTLGLLAEALRSTRELADQISRQGIPAVPIVDAALALGHLTGLRGNDEVIWLRACLKACITDPPWTEGAR